MAITVRREDWGMRPGGEAAFQAPSIETATGQSEMQRGAAHSALCDVHSALDSLHFALCTLHCALCSVAVEVPDHGMLTRFA